MRIAISQLNFHIGNFVENQSQIINSVENAKEKNADLVIFAELAVSGYPPRDFLEFDDFIKKCYLSLKEIAKSCVGITAIVGTPIKNKTGKGKNLFNSAAVLADGEIQCFRNKTLLPNYDIFDEYRYFEPNRSFSCIEVNEKKIALTICEDLWNEDDNPLYVENPMDELIGENPDLIVNIAASPFHYKQAETRKKILCATAKKYNLPLFYVNHVGAQTELLFDGGSLSIDSHGEILKELKYFEPDFEIFDTENLESSRCESVVKPKIALIYDALVMGVRNYFQKLGFKKAILGLSGGIDSAVVAALAADALGNENVLGVLLPSQYSSDHSVKDAEDLAKNIGMPFNIIPIKELYETSESLLKPLFEGTSFGLAEENLQARARGILLMAISNKFGHILLNTSNKSEAAVGYSTLYGDMNGGLSVLGDLYKTEVFELANYINRNKIIIPINTIEKPPSAELRPDQKDSDSLPDYDILDTILFEYIENRLGPEEITNLGFDKNLVNRILKMVNITEYKRFQTPPILRVSTKAFGMGRRMPIVGKYLSQIS